MNPPSILVLYYSRNGRTAALARLENGDFDVLVIGGGITGCGVALDAATRGLKVALVERDDFSSGTSSKSSKLAHGGLRYLQQKEFGLVYEALYERTIMLRNAPHLVRELPFLIPILTRDGLMNAKIARALGSADAGVVYTTDWYANASRLRRIPLPASAQPLIRYEACVVTRPGADAAGGRAVISRLLSINGRLALFKAHFGLPPK